MKGPHSISSFPKRNISLSIRDFSFGENGPYSLSCGGNEIVCLTGVSGVGKSRFLRALADLEPYRGEVQLGERKCNEMPAPEWRSLVALIPAESRWWFSEVGLHMGGDYTQDELTQLLNYLGFDTDVLGWQVSRLSSGEKQRLALVRVLSRKPRALLLDELGSSLDQENSELLEAAVSSYQEQRKTPVLWVSHDPAQVHRIADRLVVIYQDRIEETQVFKM